VGGLDREKKWLRKNGKECVAQGMGSSHRKKIGFKARLKGTESHVVSNLKEEERLKLG